MSVLNEPLADVVAIAGDPTDYSAVPVAAVDGHVHVLAADGTNQLAFSLLAMLEPVAVLVLSYLIPFGRVQTGQSHFVTVYPNAIAVGNVRLAGQSGAAPGSGVALANARDSERDQGDGDQEDKFHEANSSAHSTVKKNPSQFRQFRQRVPLLTFDLAHVQRRDRLRTPVNPAFLRGTRSTRRRCNDHA